MSKQEAPRGSEINGEKPEDTGKPKEKRRRGDGNIVTYFPTPFPDPAEIFKDYIPTDEFSVEDDLGDRDLVLTRSKPISNQGLAGSVRKQQGKMLRTLEIAVPEDPSELVDHILSLRKALKTAHKKLEEKNDNTDENWFETAHYITEEERIIMNLYFRQFLDLDKIASIVDELPNVILLKIQSATRKRFLRDGELAKAELPDDNEAPED